MRTLIIIYAMAMSAFAYGQSDVPSIVLSETIVDAGTVDQGNPIKHIFTFGNNGTGDLRIIGIERSCGCETALLSTEQIPTGKNGQLEVKINTAILSGKIEKRIMLTTNDPQHPEITFTINAIVHPEIELSDSSIFFETAPAGKEIRKEIILTLPVDKAIKVISAKSNDPYVFATIAPFPNSDGKKVKLIAIRKAAMKPGDHYGEIIIKTDSKRTPTITIYEGGTVASGK